MRLELHKVDRVAVEPPIHFPPDKRSGLPDFWTITLELRIEGCVDAALLTLYSDRADTFAGLARLAAPQNGHHTPRREDDQ